MCMRSGRGECQAPLLADMVQQRMMMHLTQFLLMPGDQSWGFWIVRRDLGRRQMLSMGRSATGSFPRMTSVPSEGAWNVVLGQRSLSALGKAGVLQQVGQLIRVHCSGLLNSCLQLLAQGTALEWPAMHDGIHLVAVSEEPYMHFAENPLALLISGMKHSSNGEWNGSCRELGVMVQVVEGCVHTRCWRGV